MRIHSLRISGFGPFAGTEDIDFERLSAHGLFLLNGPTGAGKTSVLDAICFALYGSVPGARQEGKRLRSDHAGPGQEPSVTCRFTAQGRRFEVTRSPAWDKPSARGKNGVSAQQAKTLLRECVDGSWIEKSTRNDEAGAEIMAVLGMDREQFTRVVLLPQGDFAAFLRSKANDRLELLQKLFGTGRFEAVEQELGRQAQAAKEQVSALEGRLRILADRAESEAAALDLPELAASENSVHDDPAARLGWLQQAVGEHLEELSRRAHAAESASRDRTAALELETARQERHRRLEAATARQAAVDEAAPRCEERIARLTLHRKAEVLAAQLRSVDSTAARLRNAAGDLESALTLLRLAAAEEPELDRLDLAVPACGTGNPGVEAAGIAAAGTAVSSTALSGTAATGPGATGTAVEGAAAELGRLRSLLAVVEARLPDEERLRSLASRRAGLLAEQKELSAALAELDGRVALIQQERALLAAGVEQLERDAGTAALCAKEAAAAEELLDVIARYEAALAARDLVKARYGECLEERLEAKQHWLDLREERLANAAAELAANLADGKPCAVCGSLEHPVPAAPAAGGPSLAQEEESAHQLFESAEARFAQAGAELAEAGQLVAVLAGQGGATARDEASALAADARAAADAAEQAARELTAVRTRLDELAAAVDAAQTTRSGTGTGLARIAASLGDLAEQEATLDRALAELRGGHRTLDCRLAALEKAVAVLDKAVDAQARLERARAQAAEAQAQLEEALPEAGFASAADARRQLVDGAEAAALQDSVRAAQDEAARVAELFASRDLVLALAEQGAGFVADEARLAVLREESTVALQEARDADVAAKLALRCLASIRAIRAEYDELAGSARGPAERARMLAGLADAAAGRGENTYRMSLNSYVLAARLEQVALAASERLVAMSDGRYLLQHTDAKAARGAKSGLGLEVVDQWTGCRRDTSTLSGGESFMASLSLALGLADVVQQEAGGVEIETLFVDEGFGSLDEQSLEQVMDALEGLRDGGRVVGLVSHVGEMKQRIGTQLQVVKGRNGSTLRISESLDIAS